MAGKQGSNSDDFDTLSLGSHQMRSPLVAARSMLHTVLARYAGPLNERQFEEIRWKSRAYAVAAPAGSRGRVPCRLL